MSCFPCFKSKKSESHEHKEPVPVAQTREVVQSPTQPPVYPKQNSPRPEVNNNNKKENANNPVDNGNSSAKTFTFRELATACKNFRQECLIGEGAFGRLFKGTLQPSGQVVAVKQLDKNAMQGNKEFTVEILMLSLLNHPNLAKLIGYCADGDQRLLVYEYLSMGSVEDHLLDLKQQKKPLDWLTRMKIASGTAQGLEYLHEKANPPIIYRDLKSSNILLDEEFNPKLSDYGLAKLGGNKSQIAPRVMGNFGYCAPEYERHGELTVKSDVYCFGIVLLELISGRRALDTSRPSDEQNLVAWAQPIFRDPKRFPEMADPSLRDQFPVRSLNQAVGVAAMCLQDEPDVRPLITDVVAALSFLAVASPDDPIPVNPLPAPVPLSEHNGGDNEDHRGGLDYEDEHQEEKTESFKIGSSSRQYDSESMSSSSRSSSADESDQEIHNGNSSSLKLNPESNNKPYNNNVRASSERKSEKESIKSSGGPGLSAVHSYQPGSVGLGSDFSNNNTEMNNDGRVDSSKY